jgi:hypothetical protein
MSFLGIYTGLDRYSITVKTRLDTLQSRSDNLQTRFDTMQREQCKVLSAHRCDISREMPGESQGKGLGRASCPVPVCGLQ